MLYRNVWPLRRLHREAAMLRPSPGLNTNNFTKEQTLPHSGPNAGSEIRSPQFENKNANK
jgi:hypothetical protein